MDRSIKLKNFMRTFTVYNRKMVTEKKDREIREERGRVKYRSKREENRQKKWKKIRTYAKAKMFINLKKEKKKREKG